MKKEHFLNGLLHFIGHSPTPFHAVHHMMTTLKQFGFENLEEKEEWSLKPGKKYVLTRNGSSLIAFQMPLSDGFGTSGVNTQGFRMIGAHTDSPCLRVKPSPDYEKKHYFQLGVEVYGGALLNPWFDRDLSLAGRVYVDMNGQLKSFLIDFDQAIAVIPSLAIHLDREANNSRSINAQNHLPPVLTLAVTNFESMILNQIENQYHVRAKKLLGHDLSFYDYQKPAVIGLNDSFIAGARLDNLVSCYTGLQAICHADSQVGMMLCCHDHEEVGSQSSIGADGQFARNVLERICGNPSSYARTIDQSFLFSCDNAHGIHPNYSDRHDEQHGPLLNSGPVIKINNNQRYASNSRGIAWYRHLCEKAHIPYQQFVIRSDMACGSTIGPLSASNLGVDTLDIGVPSFAMHSIRELIGVEDPYWLYLSLMPYLAGENTPA